MIIEIVEDRISITENDGKHVACWSIDEWTEDPSVVTAIANALVLATTNPEQLRKTLA